MTRGRKHTLRHIQTLQKLRLLLICGHYLTIRLLVFQRLEGKQEEQFTNLHIRIDYCSPILQKI
ncbi:MAG: hypothetical protein AUJ49_11970 [Desulfovibrionaceae bacterium CG1_02_65_16]|nr:MAG: hypothetical protein AUJ49_11970 [Desulfovibrionaceae bacterium CG1_02_65_16]